MPLAANEFIRHFLLHILPRGFMKIRYFGFLSNTNKKQAVALIRRLLAPGTEVPGELKETFSEMMLSLTGTDITCCLKCKKGRMIIIKKVPRQYYNSS